MNDTFIFYANNSRVRFSFASLIVYNKVSATPFHLLVLLLPVL